MVDRGLPIVDGAPACPFVAFEDDRDERATAPDHRHRCYAEARPAPRALAHQDAYCLSSNFPVCPTFQDWARREAAAARPAAAAHEPATEPEAPPERHPLPPPEREPRHAPDPGLPPRRNPRRDWAAPPPWAGPAGAVPREGDDTPPFLSRTAGGTPPEARGLAGSAADRMAGGGSLVDDRGEDEDDDWPIDPARRAEPQYAPEHRRHPDPDREGRWTDRDTLQRRSESWTDPDADDEPAAARPMRPAQRPYVDRTRDRGGRIDPGERGGRTDPVGRVRAADDGRRNPDGPELFGPAWERPRRYEAYPTLRSRVSLPVPAFSRVLVAVAVLAIGVIVFFSLPAFLGVGSDGPTARPSSVAPASPTATPEPTPPPEPTPQLYTVAQGDTLSRIATRFDVTLEDLLAANPKYADDPDDIGIGDEIIIPVPAPDDGLGEGSEPPPS